MSDEYNFFRRQEALFRECILKEMSRSTEYGGIEQELESVLLLGDRVFAAFIEDLNFNRIANVADYLSKVTSFDMGSTEAEKLLEATELWLKPILWLIYPDRWNRLNSNLTKFTLFPTIRELDLLTQAELDKPESLQHEITDPVRRMIYQNRKDRNFVPHETSDMSPHMRTRFLPIALVTLLAPLYKHRVAIINRLASLITRQFPKRETEALLKMVASERGKHLQQFVGRNKFICSIKELLDQELGKSGGYLLLTGYEGIGKSAICAKLSEVLADEVTPLGANASSTRRIAPWLPTVLLHSGKQSSYVPEIVNSLIAQANTLLLEPMPLLSREDNHPFEFVSPSDFDYHGDKPIIMELGLSGKTGSRKDALMLFNDPSAPAFRLQKNKFYGGESSTSSSEYRKALYLTFARLAQEHGPITIILDALDEVSDDGSTLDFLPEQLPSGISVVVTARQNTGACAWLSTHRDTKRLRINGVESTEIPYFTKINPAEGKAEEKFNDLVWRRTQGLPLLVIAAARSIAENSGNFTSAQIDNQLNTVFSRQASEWHTIPSAEPDILHHILLLLAIFEPATPLKLDIIQSYVEFKLKHQYTLAHLRELLQPVASQIDGLESGTAVKIGVKAFAEYVRTTYCSNNDIRRSLDDIVQWLVSDQELSVKPQVRFLEYWTDSSTVRNDSYRRIAETMISHLESQRNFERLFALARNAVQGRNRRQALLPFVVRCLRSAADMDHAPSMHMLGSMCADGDGVTQDMAVGASLLRRSADLGHLPAMIELSGRLFGGANIEMDRVEGEVWLRRAVEQNDSKAKLMLVLQLLDGTLLAKETNEGEMLLRDLAEEGNATATLILATKLLDGVGLTANAEEGEAWLQKLADDGNHQAIRILADRYIDANGVARNTELGESMLRGIADKGDSSAMLALGNRLLDGKGFLMNSAEGEKWLRKAANHGHAAAKIPLAIRLIDGKGLDQNIAEGEALLRRAIDDGSTQAMFILGSRLLDGPVRGKNTKEGLGLLRQASELRYAEAMVYLGQYLLEADGISRNLREAEKWLRTAANMGAALGMAILGIALLEGDKLAKDQIMGERWLRRAANTEDPQAMRVLGLFLLMGTHLQQDGAEAKYWLTRAADKGDLTALNELGVLLWTDTSSTSQDVERGLTYLRTAADLNSIEAMLNLGQALIDDRKNVERVEEGVRWLRQAQGEGSNKAPRMLGVHYYICHENYLAAECFLQSIECGNTDARSDLAYMVRRSEVPPGISTPSISELLAQPLAEKYTLALINHALCLAAGFECSEDWRGVDKAIARIDGPHEVVVAALDWWNSRIKDRADAEGHLVIGLLVRHHLVVDPDGLEVADRMALARAGSWRVPEWMDCELPTVSHSS